MGIRSPDMCCDLWQEPLPERFASDQSILGSVGSSYDATDFSLVAIEAPRESKLCNERIVSKATSHA
jgi:hypothetical protein